MKLRINFDLESILDFKIKKTDLRTRNTSATVVSRARRFSEGSRAASVVSVLRAGSGSLTIQCKRLEFDFHPSDPIKLQLTQLRMS
jgi:hypothetical protein